MYVPSEDMKINRFRAVSIPRPIEYMRRFGAAAAPASAYTGEEFAPLPRNKVDYLADAERYDAMMQREELAKAKDQANG